MLDYSVADLRVLRAVVQRGSFTAAAAELGYTQSAVSKRMAALERAAGVALAVRERRGVRLTGAGEILLRHAAVALAAMDEAERELRGADAVQSRPVRLGAFASAAAGIVPGALARLGHERGEVAVAVREGTSAVLVRALRAGTLDLALLADVAVARGPDDSSPGLEVEVLADGPLRIAVGPGHRLFGRSEVAVDELALERWVVARSDGQERLLGVWPGAPGSADAPFVVRDWLAKLALVAAGVAITTIPDVLVGALTPSVRAVNVSGGLVERRRVLLARAPGGGSAEVDAVAGALRRVAAGA